MKKYLLGLLFCTLFPVLISSAQVTAVYLSVNGGFTFKVRVGEESYVNVTTGGALDDMMIHGKIEYYGAGNNYNKVRRAGNVNFEYYGPGIHYGKISRIGNMSFQYYGAGDHYGKISSVSGTRFNYYGPGNHYSMLSSVGGVSISYYGPGNFYPKLKSVGPNSFTYYDSGPHYKKLKSQNTVVNSAGITFYIRESYKR